MFAVPGLISTEAKLDGVLPINLLCSKVYVSPSTMKYTLPVELIPFGFTLRNDVCPFKVYVLMVPFGTSVVIAVEDIVTGEGEGFGAVVVLDVEAATELLFEKK